jgi:outer membrane receptor protein involved in Fe transport
LHFGIPRKDGSKDDIQLLYNNQHLNNIGYFSTNDMGGPNFLNAIGFGVPAWPDAYQYNGTLGTPIPSNYQSLAQPYYFPLSPQGRALFDPIPFDREDAFVNDQAITKLQYQRNFGTKAFLRLYGYTFYSDWLNNGPQSGLANYIAFVPPDYELSTHTRGVSLLFSDQITPQHLFSLQGSYTTASTIRDNNTQWVNGFYGPNTVNGRTVIGAVVNAGDPFSGYCFDKTGAAVSCFRANGTALGRSAVYGTLQQAFNGTLPALPATCALPGSTNTACEFLTVGNGQYATYNTVKPQFSAFSITDNWKPSDRFTLNAGVRLELFSFIRPDTFNSPARTFWYNAFNLDNCINTTSGALVGRAPGAACPTGTVPSFVSNPPASSITYHEWQPRVGLTYSFSPSTVLRASYGRYSQAPNSAFQQYDALQANAPILLYGTYSFQKFGFTTPNHDIYPPVSNNYDLSLEHQFGRDWGVKLTPFFRKTQGQIQQFYLNQQTNFVSGLNVGQQTSQGVEFELDKGDFVRNGISAKLSFTYTNSFIKYTNFANGSNVIAPINQAIVNYNAYTSFCASNPNDPRCAGGSTASGNPAGPCFSGFTPAAGTTTPAVPGTGSACGPGTVANPYWNAPVQALFDPNGNYATYDIFPGGVVSSAQTYGAPYVASLLVQYKRNKFAITPALQFVGGIRYGAPEAEAGVAPEFCPGGTAIDPGRYQYGAAGGTGYDFSACDAAGTYAVVTPNHMSHQFDNLGNWVQPNQLSLHMQLSYEVSPRLTLVGTFANLWNSCWGGSKVPWSFPGACGYSIVPGAGSGPQPIGNNYNPGDALQPILATPYVPFFAATPSVSPAQPGLPFRFFVEARLKI